MSGGVIFVALLCVISVVFWLIFLSGKKEPTSTENIPAQKRIVTPHHHWPPEEFEEVEVVGESHYKPALRRLAGSHGDESADQLCIATLVPEPSNPYDRNAVRVDINNLTVGYLSRGDAPLFLKRLADHGLTGCTTSCEATICGGFLMDDGTRAYYGVTLAIKELDY